MARREGWGRRTNRAVDGMASRVDGRTEDAARRAAPVLVLAVKVLRWPTLVLLVLPIPFVLATFVLGLTMDGWWRVLVVVLSLVGAAISAAFAGRRRRILQAVEVPDALATELGIAVNLSGRVTESRGVLEAVAGGGGWRVLSRMKGLWSGVTMTGRWIDGIGDLPRARYFFPPKIGTTVMVTVASLWLVPISIVVCFLSFVGAVAHAF
ncbi:MAG: hypothetical protein PGN07_00025 [Aeromicrobium erythreum]